MGGVNAPVRGDIIDNLHAPVSEIERHIALPPIANRIHGLPVSGDVIAVYWRPILRARKDAGRDRP